VDDDGAALVPEVKVRGEAEQGGFHRITMKARMHELNIIATSEVETSTLISVANLVIISNEK
jgi:hypothetical protein